MNDAVSAAVSDDMSDAVSAAMSDSVSAAMSDDMNDAVSAAMSAAKSDANGILFHPFGPLYNESSKVLILGSFPSVKSREQNFFYGHPQNRFWKVIAAEFGAEVPETIEDKKRLILSNGLALWDSIASCEITGSSDSSIRNAKANDISVILSSCDIRRIYCNGKKSHELYRKYIEPVTGRSAECLPSTSPANAQWTLDRLIEAWAVIRT